MSRKSIGVGYGRPPAHSQFKPGVSGNPKGRRKGVKEVDAVGALKTLVTLRGQDGRSRQVPRLVALIESTFVDAFKGNARARDTILKLARDLGCFNVIASEDDASGIDHGAELRRRLDLLAATARADEDIDPNT